MNILNGIDEARRRIEEQERTALQYTRMSNDAASGRSSPVQRTAVPAEKAPPRITEDIHMNAGACDHTEKPPDELSALTAPLDRAAAMLGTDSEKLLILALIVLLGSEGADIALLAALAYLLL